MELKGNLIVSLKPGQAKVTRNGVVVKNMSDFTARVLINETAIEARGQENATEGKCDEQHG